MDMTMSPPQAWDINMTSASSTSRPNTDVFTQCDFQSTSFYGHLANELAERRPTDEFDKSPEFGEMLVDIMKTLVQEARQRHDGCLYNDGTLSPIDAQFKRREV